MQHTTQEDEWGKNACGDKIVHYGFRVLLGLGEKSKTHLCSLLALRDALTCTRLYYLMSAVEKETIFIKLLKLAT